MLQRFIRFVQAMSEGCVFVLLSGVVLTVFTMLFASQPLTWCLAFAVSGGLVYASVFACPMHAKWMARASSRGWHDWAEKERIGLYSWVALGITGLAMVVLSLYAGY